MLIRFLACNRSINLQTHYLQIYNICKICQQIIFTLFKNQALYAAVQKWTKRDAE